MRAADVLRKTILGEMEIPADAYHGIQTVRAIENFPVSGLQEDPAFIAAYVTLKKAAALANIELGVMDEERGRAIVQAAAEARALFGFGRGVGDRG